MNNIRNFGVIARGLARNPIGIIALFIILVYGFASLVTAFTSSFTPGERLPLIYFLVLFPVLVLIVFAWLVSHHGGKLFAPDDFENESNFVRLQLANVDSKVAGLEERAKARELHSEKAMRIIYEIVNNRVSYSVEEIVKAFSYAPKEILVHAFGYLETIRKQTVFNLLDSENETEDRKYLIRTR